MDDIDSATADGGGTSTADVLAIGRIAVGVGSLLAPGVSGRILGFPGEHLNATSRTMGRLFGIREIALGVFTLGALHGNAPKRVVYMINAGVDGGDAVVFAATLLGRRGITRASLGSLLVAVPVAATWLKLAAEAS